MLLRVSHNFSQSQSISLWLDCREALALTSIGEAGDDYPALDEGLNFVFFFRKQALERSDEAAFATFDGGETVYVKIVDKDGAEYVHK